MDVPEIKWGHLYKAGTAFEYNRGLLEVPSEEDTVVFVLLEDRSVTPQDVLEHKPGHLCLIVTGCIRGGGPGDIVRLKGIIDSAKQIVL